MRVYIGCFGSGLGHAARMFEIAKELRARGAELRFSSSGEVASLIEAKGYSCNVLPLADVRYSDAGEFQVKETILDSPSILARTSKQFMSELANIGRFAPDAVLSDSALPTVLAGRVLRLPTYTVLNQLNLTSSHNRKSAPSRLFSVGMSAGMGELWELSDRVFLPDLPPPYTISEKNLWGSGVEKARYVGFLFSRDKSNPDEAAEEFSREKKPKVFWQVSGPPKTRSSLLERALKSAEELSGEFSFVVSGGDPLGSASPHRVGSVWYYGWCGIADFYFGACDVVVSRAGHGTIAQAIMSAKPMLLIPIPKQPEQEGNADKAARLGVSVTLQQGTLSPEALRGSLRSLLEGPYRDGARRLGEIASKYDARSAIVSAMESGATEARRGRR
jgi:UDP-N-acetylglucosamine--N-acetylmuramyl-(pentapeptide) pyrophosphoryl-undecaprenol N-acetylglucosamine transferase